METILFFLKSILISINMSFLIIIIYLFIKGNRGKYILTFQGLLVINIGFVLSRIFLKAEYTLTAGITGGLYLILITTGLFFYFKLKKGFYNKYRIFSIITALLIIPFPVQLFLKIEILTALWYLILSLSASFIFYLELKALIVHLEKIELQKNALKGISIN